MHTLLLLSPFSSIQKCFLSYRSMTHSLKLQRSASHSTVSLNKANDLHCWNVS